MSEKRPLQVGDRVRGYSMTRSSNQLGERVVVPEILDGPIHEIKTDHILVDTAYGITSYHPKQVRRLIKRERRYWAMAISPSGKISEIQESAATAPLPLMLPPCSNQDMPVWIRVCEVRK